MQQLRKALWLAADFMAHGFTGGIAQRDPGMPPVLRAQLHGACMSGAGQSPWRTKNSTSMQPAAVLLQMRVPASSRRSAWPQPLLRNLGNKVRSGDAPGRQSSKRPM
jgi:hypothetical protein